MVSEWNSTLQNPSNILPLLRNKGSTLHKIIWESCIKMVCKEGGRMKRVWVRE